MGKYFVSALFVIGFSFSAIAATTPDWNMTPGVLCSPQDPNFKDMEYPEQIARCNRNVTIDEKLRVAAAYGNIPQSDWHNYEFDHLIPLCAGGSNDDGNLWPQPIDEAHNKDGLEDEICAGLRNGSLTQVQAVQKVHDWFAQN